MRACYQQLGPEDRAAIMIRLRDGHSLRNIATMLNRSPSSISRDSLPQPYLAEHAL